MSPKAPRVLSLAVCLALLPAWSPRARADEEQEAAVATDKAAGIDRAAATPGLPDRRSVAFDAAGAKQAPVRMSTALSLKEAFLLALQQNKDIDVALLGGDVADARIDSAKGEFDPRVFLDAKRSHNSTAVAGVPLDRSENVGSTVSGGLRQRLVTGTNVELRAANDYSRDVTGTSTLNPEYSPTLSLSVRQDILKNFGVDINRTNIVVAQNNSRISEEELRNQIINSLFEVESAYWDLYFSIEDLKVRKAQQEGALQLVLQAEAFFEEGERARISVTRAKSNAAGQAVSILSARNRVRRLRHRLLRAMGIIDVHQVADDFDLADAPPKETFATSLEDALEVALRVRPDYVQAELTVANTDLRQRFAKNQRLPSLQLVGQYSLNGLGDDFGDGADELEDGRFNSWEVGLVFEWPIPNRTARGDYRAAYLEHIRARVRRDAVLERITRELADALDDLQTTEERITTAGESRRLAQSLLVDEEKGFSLGLSTALDLLDAQEDLAQAERDEARARADYAKALADLFRAQGNFLEMKQVPFISRYGRSTH